MSKTVLFLFFFLVIATVSNAQTITGVVKDEAGFPVPGVRVAVVNTTYGVRTNPKGVYFLTFEKKDTVILKYSMIGFGAVTDTLTFTDDRIVNDVVLTQATELNTVEVYANKRDIAKEVMTKLIDNKKKLRNQFTSYQCETYIKTTLEKEVISIDTAVVQVDSIPSVTTNVTKEKMNFIESNSITRFQQKDTYQEEIVAHKDYSEKSNSTVTVGVSFSNQSSLVPTQTVEYNPYIFFEKTADGDFDLYENLLDLPKISDKQLVSPLAATAFINYKFTLNSIFYENGQKIYDIAVEPRFKEAPLFEGNLYVVDSLWVLKSMDLTINPGVMPLFQSLRIIQDYDLKKGKYVITRREFNYTLKDGGELVWGNTRANHTNYEFNVDFENKSFGKAVVEYQPEAFDRDSTYWESIRPIQLKQAELRFIEVQDSIERLTTSNAYIDSVNNEYNKLRFWDFVLNGVGFRSREKKQEIYINPLINQVQPFGVGGYRHRLGGFYSKEFKNAQDIKVDGAIDYGFRNQDVKGNLGVAYTFLPKHFGNLKISGGDIYDYITMEQSISNFLSRGNYVRKTYFKISQRYEITNGLYGRVSFDYSTRRDISNMEYAPWVDSLIEIGFWEKPTPYETYTVSIAEFEFLYRFKQQYILKGNKKIIIGTEYPELRLTYKRGIPNLFNSDVNFNFLEIGVRDEVTFGTLGEFKWDVEAGTFFGKTANEVQFIERKFFRGSDFFFFSNPLTTLQLLDSTFNTTQPYLQAFAIHHFNGAIMNKIPLINKLKLELVGGAAALLIQDANYAHIEFYAGIERKFKIKRQLFKVSTFYVIRENNVASVNLNFKFGLDFYNSFTNSWSY